MVVAGGVASGEEAFSAGRASTWWAGGRDITRRRYRCNARKQTYCSSIFAHVLVNYSIIFHFYGLPRVSMDSLMIKLYKMAVKSFPRLKYVGNEDQ